MSNSTNVQTKVCIFDVDGTILDTETLYTEAINSALEEYGQVMKLETKLKMMGRDSISATKILLEDTKIPLTCEEFISKVDVFKNKVFKNTQFLAGAEKLIRHLYDCKIPIAIATSSAKNFFELKITNHKDLFSLFGQNITCGDDPAVKNPKPNPDIYLLAKDRLGLAQVDPSECLVFEDAVNGVKSGVNANMNVVWIPDLRFCELADIPSHKHGASKVITSLEDFLPEHFGLPPYKI
ncbi:hypothetical protein BB561_000646 [Smittium simulii]|uniref:FCP1 homology domain-containing protein n=1 Tax=Smittium simulii TaxID=133385 RepID=A0A2T9YYC5_9FUNG|nr:hypothetical protein BB561_000646 [Smittium simulii]